MRIGIAGVGRIGVFHARTLAAAPAVDSLVVTDTDAARAAEVAAMLSVDRADSTEELLRCGLDGLVIAAPTAAHAALIMAAADAGIPVFCEKPVAADVATTRAVQVLVNSSGARVQIGFQRRFDAGFVAARKAVRSGSLGWVHTIRAGTLDPAPPPAAYIATSGGIFRDCSVHDFDAIRWSTGCEVVEVVARGANRGARFFADAGDVDTAAALLTLDDGAFVALSATRYNGQGYDVRLEFLGEKGSIAAGLDDRLPLRSAEPGVRFPAGPAYQGFMQRFADAYVAELTAFTDLVAGTCDVTCGVADALEAFLIAEACEISRREGRAVSMDEVRAA